MGGGHKIYWEDWGNPKAKVPIFYLHGGPGAGIKEKDKLLFDNLRQRVIFFDQRGAGRSRPYAGLANNTTQDLINDIDKLRKHLNIGVISLAGGSWGSFLALAYAIANPEVVQKMVLWGVLLGRKEDVDYVEQGKGLQNHFIDVWKRYIEVVPEIERSNTISYYLKQFEHRDKAVRTRYLKEWVILHSSLLKLDDQADLKRIEVMEDGDEQELGLAKLEATYFGNNFFVEDNFVLDNAPKIKQIPTVLVQGRYDFLCPPNAAFELQEKMGDECYLHVIPSGHMRGDAILREVFKAYCRSFFD